MIILNSKQINHKLKRIASEIYERHADQNEIVLAGINTKGYLMAEKLKILLIEMGLPAVKLAHLDLNPAKPLESEARIDLELKNLTNRIAIIIDDVANSGRTLFFAMKPFSNVLLKKLEVCVLIERMHKSYPISVDYVGLRLATTIKQNIEVEFKEFEPIAAKLN